MQMVEERYGLDGFSQAHLVCQDAVPVFIPVLYEPVETLELEFLEHPVVLENRYILATVLARLLAKPIQEVQLFLHLCDVGILDDSVLRLLVELKQELVNFVVNLNPFSGLTVGYLIPIFELQDLVRTAYHRLSLPGRMGIRKVLPLDQIQPVNLDV